MNGSGKTRKNVLFFKAAQASRIVLLSTCLFLVLVLLIFVPFCSFCTILPKVRNYSRSRAFRLKLSILSFSKEFLTLLESFKVTWNLASLTQQQQHLNSSSLSKKIGVFEP